MNGNDNIVKHLGYDGVLLSMPEVLRRYPTYQDLTRLGADECYFIAGHPAALFCKVKAFDNAYSKRVADILHKAWNYRKVLLLITYSEFEVRVYNCYTKPDFVSSEAGYAKELEEAQIQSATLEDGNLSHFASFFSREAVDTGALWEAQKTLKINITKRVDAYLVDSLDRTKDALLQQGLEEKYIHALLIRSLFVLFLEDKGATKEAGVYAAINPDYTTFFDVLKDKEATYQLFAVLNRRFNGDVTRMLPGEKEQVTERHLDLVRKCFMDGDLSDNPKLYGDWRLFHFDIISVELLSEIYEHFLGASKSSKGQYYTPSNLVNLILAEKIPDNSTKWNLKILDPTCGSGIFLVESYKRLICIWKRANHRETIDFETLKTILCNNIYGIDIDATALSVAAFSLYLTLINELDPRTLWAQPTCKLPCLIHKEGGDEEVNGNLWCMDAIAAEFTNLLPKMDLVVGNPPYGTEHSQQSIKAYCKRYGFADEMSLPFIHKMTSLCPDGQLALVVNMKILTNATSTYARFREWLLSKAYVEKIYNFSIFRNAPKDFGGSLFASAKTPVAVLYYRATRPEPVSKDIIYWAPRTYVKGNLLYDIVLDSCDLKYLPRELCEKNDTCVWKIGAWGSALSYRLVEKLRRLPTLQQTFVQKGWVYGRGCNADSNSPDFVPETILDLKRIERHVTQKDAVKRNEKNKAYRKNKPGIFDAPYIVMKECPDKDGVIAGLFGGNAITTTSAFVFNGMMENDKKVLTAYLNSRLVNAFLFLTSSTWGIERERLLLEEETMQVPSPFDAITEEQKVQIIALYDTICKKRAELMLADTSEEERQIDTLFYSILGLSDLDIEVLEDVFDNSLRLFGLKEDAEAMRKVTPDGLEAYAKRLCLNLNDYYRYSGTRVSPEMLQPNVAMPLCMVIVRFGTMEKEIKKLDNKNDCDGLRRMYSLLAAKPQDGIVIRRVLRDYRNDSIILIKPNQKRLWTEMQALDDGASIFSEILAMKGEEHE